MNYKETYVLPPHRHGICPLILFSLWEILTWWLDFRLWREGIPERIPLSSSYDCVRPRRMAYRTRSAVL